MDAAEEQQVPQPDYSEFSTTAEQLLKQCRHAASLNRHHEAALLSYRLAECAIRMARTLRLQGEKK